MSRSIAARTSATSKLSRSIAARGGTLLQHLPDHVGHEEHRRVLGSFDGADHDVALTHGSLAAHAAGEVAHAAKSHHHQLSLIHI